MNEELERAIALLAPPETTPSRDAVERQRAALTAHITAGSATAHRHRTRRGGGRRRRGLAVIAITVAAAVIALVTVLPSSTSGPTDDSAFGMLVDAHVDPAPATVPHFNLSAISVGYVPTGYRLVQSQRKTDASDALGSSQYAAYRSGNSTYDVQVEPMTTQTIGEIVGKPTKGTALTFTTVNGHAAALVVGAQVGHHRAPTTSICDTPGTTATETIGELSWTVPTVHPGVVLLLSVNYFGQRPITDLADQLGRVARSVGVNAGNWSCWTIGGRYHLMKQTVTSGGCTPGQADSPANEPLRYRGPLVATGSLYGEKWEFRAAAANCKEFHSAVTNPTLWFNLDGANGVGCGGTFMQGGRMHAVAVDVEELANGHRLVCGAAPINVTSVVVTSSANVNGIRAEAFTKKLFGHAYFAVSIGRSGESCYYECVHGTITLALYSGTRLISKNVFQAGATESSGASMALNQTLPKSASKH